VAGKEPTESSKRVKVPEVVAREVGQRTVDWEHVDHVTRVWVANHDHTADVVDAAAVVFYDNVRKVDRCAASKRIGTDTVRLAGQSTAWAHRQYFDDLVVDETVACAPVDNRPFAAVLNRSVTNFDDVVMVFPVDRATARQAEHPWVALETDAFNPIWRWVLPEADRSCQYPQY
jgi:hypothetical protein